MEKHVAIIDYGVGNLASVLNAFEYISAPVKIISHPDQLREASHALLPGVGAFGQGMENLKQAGWVEPIKEFALEKRKPFLGICLGMQLLAEVGEEFGVHEGLSLIKGTVKKMPESEGVRIPHIGWNEVATQNDSKTYQEIDNKEDYYFVHSYVFDVTNPSDVTGVCEHGEQFVASVEQDNIWGAQFHPEKSHTAGLKILENFWNYSLAC